MASNFSLKTSAEGLNVLSEEQYKEVKQIIGKASDDLKDKVGNLSKNTNISSIIKGQELGKLKKNLDKSWKDVHAEYKNKMTENMETVSKSVVDDNFKWLKKNGIIAEGAFTDVPTDIVKSIASGQVYSGDWTLSKALWSDVEKKQKDINAVIAQGLAENKSAYDIAKDLEQYVDPNAKKDWKWSKVYPGTSKKIDYNAQRLARTMISHAYQQSLVRVVNKNPFVTGLKWRSAMSARTCELCKERNGQIYPKDELPMDHPNGLCTYEAVIEDDSEKIADRLADWAKGGSDAELDGWAQDMMAKDMGVNIETKPGFDEMQQSWLEQMGYTPDNMPKDFTEWSHKLTSSQKSLLFDDLELNGKEHPFQELEKWYNENLTTLDGKQIIIKGGSGDYKFLKYKKNVADAFSQGRKDKAYWFRDKQKSYDVLIGPTGEVWKGLNAQERRGIYDYTEGSGHMNRPLRGYEGSWYNFKGVGNVDLNAENGKKNIEGATSALAKSKYDFDMWLQRGVETRKGTAAFLGESEDFIMTATQKELEEKLLGKVVTDPGFTSTTAAKGGGFSGDVLNIYAPSGTQMLYVEPVSAYGGGSGGVKWDGEQKQSYIGHENEVLLQRGTSFRVSKIERGSNGQLYFDLDIVGQSVKT